MSTGVDDCPTRRARELTFQQGDLVLAAYAVDAEWLEVRTADGTYGIVPASQFEVLSGGGFDPTSSMFLLVPLTV
jgi:hypothetical protein